MRQPAQQQDVPGVQAEMSPRPDCGEDSYRGHGRLGRTVYHAAEHGHRP